MLFRSEEDLKVQPVEGEFVLDQQVSTLQPNEWVVDNEDPGFKYSVSDNVSLLHKWIIKEEETGLKYSGFNNWRPPLNWTLTTNSGFYGLYVRSAYYIKAGTGDITATWELPVKEAGNYDIYAHISSAGSRGFQMGRGGRSSSGDEKGEYQYFIYHSDGETEQTLRINTAEAVWNLLGSYYLSTENSRVVLTNKTTLRTVVADAIKIVKL